jgi:hypothetical protein
MTIYTTPEAERDILDVARAMAVETLSGLGVYHEMSLPDQEQVYRDLVQQMADKERARRGLAVALPMATDSGKQMGFDGYKPGFEGSTQAFNELVDSVDFPQFVADLLKAVFDANLTVMKQQTDSYIKLMKEATKSTADFIKKINDDDTLASLAESKSEQYNLSMDQAPDGTMKLGLTDPDGNAVDMEDTKVKQAIMETKVRMAQEHRAALREVLLMGVTRLVVEKGQIEAGVEFQITANRKSTASHQDQNVNVASLQLEYGGGLMGSLFGGPSGSFNMTNTNIQVNTAQKEATDTLAAKLQGKVNIQFKTDYFELDQFADMYGDGGVRALQPPGAAAGGALPAGAAAAR